MALAPFINLFRHPAYSDLTSQTHHEWVVHDSFIGPAMTA